MLAHVVQKEKNVIVLIPVITLNRLTRDCEVSIAGERLSPSWGYLLDSLKPRYQVIDNLSGYRALVRTRECSLSTLQLRKILNALTH